MTDRQKLLITIEALKWINRLSQILQHISETDACLERAYRRFKDTGHGRSLEPIQRFLSNGSVQDRMFELCLIPLILRQIDDHIRVLKSGWSGELAVKGKQYRKMFRGSEIRDLRNVLEHLADFLIGRGNEPNLMRKDEPDPSVQTKDGEVISMTLFGKRYMVRDLINAALDLIDPLTDYKLSLSQQ